VVFSLDVVSPRAIQEAKPLAADHKKMEASVLRLVDAAQIAQSRRIIVGDSAFAQVSCLLELRKRGLYAIFNVKKRATWPLHSFGAELDGVAARLKHMGDCLAKTAKIGNYSYSIFSAQLPFGQHTLMATCGKTSPSSNSASGLDHQSNANKSYRVPEVFDIFYKGAHAVDMSNQLRQGHLSIEQGWNTRRWWIRSLAFFIALADVNAFNLHTRFLHPGTEMSVQQWRLGLAFDLLGLDAGNSTGPAPKPVEDEHRRRKLPKNGRYDYSTNTIVSTTTKYAERRCTNCNTKTRLYCDCDPSVPYCDDCLFEHARDPQGSKRRQVCSD
jgi:hypothetical protein